MRASRECVDMLASQRQRWQHETELDNTTSVEWYCE